MSLSIFFTVFRAFLKLPRLLTGSWNIVSIGKEEQEKRFKSNVFCLIMLHFSLSVIVCPIPPQDWSQSCTFPWHTVTFCACSLLSCPGHCWKGNTLLEQLLQEQRAASGNNFNYFRVSAFTSPTLKYFRTQFSPVQCILTDLKTGKLSFKVCVHLARDFSVSSVIKMLLAFCCR